mmetsp:Transcript_38304/g.73393  ORF Transcript_38304/g.73393 Transcript_38304/m.73393 type:complete len:250 (-) Transcript_38304:317-1066(-)
MRCVRQLAQLPFEPILKLVHLRPRRRTDAWEVLHVPLHQRLPRGRLVSLGDVRALRHQPLHVVAGRGCTALLLQNCSARGAHVAGGPQPHRLRAPLARAQLRDDAGRELKVRKPTTLEHGPVPGVLRLVRNWDVGHPLGASGFVGAARGGGAGLDALERRRAPGGCACCVCGGRESEQAAAALGPTQSVRLAVCRGGSLASACGAGGESGRRLGAAVARARRRLLPTLRLKPQRTLQLGQPGFVLRRHL